jgi:hypothetical protein
MRIVLALFLFQQHVERERAILWKCEAARSSPSGVIGPTLRIAAQGSPPHLLVGATSECGAVGRKASHRGS